MFGVSAAGSTSNNNWTVANGYGFYLSGASSLTKNVNLLGNTAAGLNVVHRVVISTLGNLTLYRNGLAAMTSVVGLSTGSHSLYFSSNGVSNKPVENIAFVHGNSPFTCIVDTDNDGVANGLDLDSDGDGCSDGVESGNTLVANNNIVNFNTGLDANNNGVLDVYENGSSRTLNYSPSYNLAIDSLLNACLDTDGDGVQDLGDIDDDNDGILDRDEGCEVVLNPVDILSWTGMQQ